MDIVILNYNSATDTSSLVNSIVKMESLIEHIYIVDNHSSDPNDKEILRGIVQTKKGNTNISLILSEKNAGYAAGNNLGIKESVRRNPRGLIAIANPDIKISKKSLEIISSNFDEFKTREEKVGLISPWVINKGTRGEVAWKLPNLFSDIIASSFIVKKMFGNILSYRNLKRNTGLKEVEVLPGSLLIFDKQAIKDIGFFSERTFLYCEERIIAKKLKDKNYRSYLNTDITYLHEHSKTINKFVDFKRKIDYLYDGKVIYYKYYYKSRVAAFIVNLFRFYTKMEMQLVYFLKKEK
ncbi:rhamnosyltransferase [Shouchella clausii]|uniref:glycosyltransferase n=1 Tax=Shouchella clausii TaxID=79880 RepID=UPI001B04ED96|nr:glycosyltransferase [Shouchella clausii]GIN09776.1 rhamnosyltransferase [Shouchella clausii]